MLLGIMCIGPSQLFAIPNKSWIVILGLALGGLGRGVISGFPLADAMKGGQFVYPDQSTEVSDIISATMIVGAGVNSFLTPNAATYLNSELGFSNSMDIVLLLTFVTTICFVVSSLWDMKRERIKNTEITSPLFSN